MIDVEAMPCIADIPRVQAERRGDASAFWFEGRTTNYKDLNHRSSQIANGLIGLGVEPGDRIAYLAKNTDKYYEILLGAAKSRTALAGMNYRLAAPELKFILTDAKAKILFVSPDYFEAIASIAADCPDLKHIFVLEGDHDTWPSFDEWRDSQSSADPFLPSAPDDDIIQLYTSGTTGLPKGVCLTNANYHSFFGQAGTMDWAAYRPDENIMNAMPLFHVAGVNVGLVGIAQGSKVYVLREVDPMLILKLIEEEKINHAFWVPAVIMLLTQMPNVENVDFSSLSMVTYGASPIAEALLIQAQKLMGCRFCQLYGLTETVGGGTYLPPDAHDPARGKLRSCGVPWPGAEVRCVDSNDNPVPTGQIGEIVIQSGFVMKGYWNRPEATAEALRNGFFHTGDAGYFDEEGYLYIHDRIKDMIVSGGENVYPAEVENCLYAHPDIADVAVIGVPDEKWGESVKAVIVVNEGASPSDEAIIGWAKERIASYKCPKSIDRIQALPRNPSGKILRKDLREPYWAGISRRVG